MTNAVKVQPRLRLNPWAYVPLEVAWPFDKWTCTDAGQASREPAEPDMAHLLGLPEDWPGPEPAFPLRTRRTEC